MDWEGKGKMNGGIAKKWVDKYLDGWVEGWLDEGIAGEMGRRIE